jgi:CDP-diacylglycerol pyrophosphatase
LIDLVTVTKSAALVASVLSGLSAPAGGMPREALWHVINGLCVSNQQLTANPAPCSVVDSKRGFAVLWAGAAHYLLVPTAKISGIESDDLLAPAAPNYWAFAWQSRSFLNDTVGTTVPRSVVGLAINSAQARTQDQLHIHIGCMRRDVLAALRRFEAKFAASRSARTVVLARRQYTVVRIQGDALDQANPFKLVAQSSPAARDDMAYETVAVAGATFADGSDGFYLLSRRSRGGDTAAAEHLLDYKCKAVTSPR